MINFTHSRLTPIMRWLSKQRKERSAGDLVSFIVTCPDDFRGSFTGTSLPDGRVIHSFQSLMDLAELNGFRMNTPRQINPTEVRVYFEKLDSDAFWPPKKADEHRYSPQSFFSEIHKSEEPWFHTSFLHALQDVSIQPGWHILDLGMNKGDEIQFIKDHTPPDLFSTISFTGIDLNRESIEYAARRFQTTSNVTPLLGDLRNLESLDLDVYDLIIAIDTLQSTGLDGKNLILTLRKKLLKPNGTFILGFPNTRYLDGTLHYGARMRNYTEPELSLLVRDLFFYRRYLQQQGFTVKITGKYTVFLTAIKNEKESTRI